MAIDRHPTGAVLRQLLRYDPQTGRLYWRERDERFCGKVALNMWNKRFAGKEAFARKSSKGYLRGTLFKKDTKAHRVIWAMHYDEWPDQIDHINGRKDDNRLENLRAADQFENMANRRKPAHNTSGCVGVYKYKESQKDGRNFWAEVTKNKRRQFLGRFETLDQAAAARKAAEQKLGFHPNHGR